METNGPRLYKISLAQTLKQKARCLRLCLSSCCKSLCPLGTRRQPWQLTVGLCGRVCESSGVWGGGGQRCWQSQRESEGANAQKPGLLRLLVPQMPQGPSPMQEPVHPEVPTSCQRLAHRGRWRPTSLGWLLGGVLGSAVSIDWLPQQWSHCFVLRQWLWLWFYSSLHRLKQCSCACLQQLSN